MTKVNVPIAPKPQTLALFDKPIAEMQDIFIAELPWLDHSFGKSQRLIKAGPAAGKQFRSEREYQYPGVYITDRQYVDVSPTEEFGNFSFFIADGKQEVFNINQRSINDIKLDCGIVFWFNLDNIYPDSPDRSLELVKEEILRVLYTKIFLKSSRFELAEIEERAEDIYSEYDLKEMDTQFLMQPFAGLRFNGTLSIKHTC